MLNVEKELPDCVEKIEEILPYLKIPKFAFTNTAGAVVELLGLWSAFLKASAKKWNPMLFSPIAWISRREELDVLKTAKPGEKPFLLSKIYRVLLFDTDLVVENLLKLYLKIREKAIAKPARETILMLDLCAKTLAVSCDRIPGHMESILEKLSSQSLSKIF